MTEDDIKRIIEPYEEEIAELSEGKGIQDLKPGDFVQIANGDYGILFADLDGTLHIKVNEHYSVPLFDMKQCLLITDTHRGETPPLSDRELLDWLLNKLRRQVHPEDGTTHCIIEWVSPTWEIQPPKWFVETAIAAEGLK